MNGMGKRGRGGRADDAGSDGPFDLGGSERNPLPFPEHVASRGRLTIDPDQVVLRLPSGIFSWEQLLHGGSFGHLDVVGEPATLLLMYSNHHVNPEKMGNSEWGVTPRLPMLYFSVRSCE